MATNANASIKKNTIIKKITVGRPLGVGQVSNGNLTGLDDVDGAMLTTKAASDSIGPGLAGEPGNPSYLIRWDSDRGKFGFYPAGLVLKDNLKFALLLDSNLFQTDSQAYPLPAQVTIRPQTGFTAGTYGTATAAPTLTVNDRGLITAIGTNSITTVDSFGFEPSLGRIDLKLSTGTILNSFITIDAFTTDSLAEGTTNLYHTTARGVAAAKTALSVDDVGGDGSLSYDSNLGKFTYTGPSALETRAHFSASNGITYNSTSGKFTGPQPLDSASNPVFNQVTLTGNLRGPAELVIDPAAYGDATGSVKILGNLQVEGTQTTVNSTVVSLNDKNLLLADSALDSAASNDGGITLGGSGASLIYSHGDAAWVFNRPLRRDLNLLSFHNTDDVSEGPTNRYYLTARTDSDAKRAISVTDNGGDGGLSYNNSTGVITYDGPTALEVRSHFSAKNPVTKDSSGVFGIDSAQLYTYFIDKNLSSGLNGKIIRNSSINIKGNQFILDGDSDTIIEASSDDEVKFTIGGKESLKVKGGNQFSDFTNMELISDEASGIASPSFDLYRTSASPLPGDTLGRINFYGKDDSGNSQLYSSINGSIITTTNGSEEGSIELNVNKSGAFSGSTTFIVTVTGGNRFVLDGVTNPVITLKRGVTYTFDQSAGTNSTHPLAFKDGGGSSYTTGVTVNGVAGNPGASVVFAVPLNAPDSLLYYCTTHGNAMGNSISVEDEGIHLNTVFHDNRIVFHRDQYLEWKDNKNSIHECILDWDSPTAARTIKLPDATGTILVGALGNNPRNYFSAGGDLSYDSSIGRFSFNVEAVYTKANFDSDFNDALDETTLNGTGLSFDSATNTLSITNTGVVAGHYGSGTKIPKIKINAQGQIDSASLVDVAGISSINFDSATGVFAINTADGGNFTTTLFDSDYTKKRSREAFSLIDAGGDGSMTYDSASGKFTYTGPSAAEVKAHFSGGNGITLTADGRIDIDSAASPTVNSLVNTLGSISSTPTLVQATSGSGVIVDTTAHNSDFMSIEYTVHMTEDVIDASQVSKVLVTYNKSTVSFAEYGMVSSFINDSDIGTLSADVSGGNIRLQFTRAAGMGTVNIKPVKQIIS